MYPLLLLLISLWIMRFAGKNILHAYFILLILVSAPYLVNQYRSLSKPGDWIRVANYITTHQSGNEPIFVYPSDIKFPLSMYQISPERMVPIPKEFNYQSYRLADLILQDEKTIDDIIASNTKANQNFWIVTTLIKSYRGFNFNRNLIEEHILKNYAILSERQFHGSKLYYLKNKSLS